MTLSPADLRTLLGDVDIYLFDQIVRGRIAPSHRILDVGCGTGRNLVYLLRLGARIAAVDPDPDAIHAVRTLVADLAPSLPDDDIRVESLPRLSFPAASFDTVICNAVLHFATDHQEFDAMVDELVRVLRPGGRLMARLASNVALERQTVPLGGGRHRLPDGTERYLVDPAQLAATMRRCRLTLAEPLKTTVVHGQRSMTTWVTVAAPASD